MPSHPRKTGPSGRPTAQDPTASPSKASNPQPTATPKAATPRRPKATRKRARGPHVDWAPAYLAALAINGEKVESAKRAKIDRKNVYLRRMSDEAFRAAEAEAMKMAADSWESEAIRRATRGLVEKRYDVVGGKRVLVSTKTVYSDTILLRLLTKLETGSWRDSAKVEHTGEVDFRSMTRAERVARLAEAEALARRPL